MSTYILTCNAGSNSLKSALYTADGPDLRFRFLADRIHDRMTLDVKDGNGKTIATARDVGEGYEQALVWILKFLNDQAATFRLAAAGHRIVHGGPNYEGPVVVNDEVIDNLTQLIPFAPAHQPHNIRLIEALQKLDPGLLQVACFDTGFHRTQGPEAASFALPRKLVQEHQLYRYGFHGLSYEYLTMAMADHLQESERKRVIALHMGGGCSACAISNGHSVATTMGLTALDGMMMNTRPGRLDPGVVLYLCQHTGRSVEEVAEILYKQSGLLGVSGISGDMRDLAASDDPHAAEAVDLFCAMAARETAALVTDLGGLGALIFSGAMGADDAVVRSNMVARLGFLGVSLDSAANRENRTVVSDADSRVKVLVLPTDEEIIIARYTCEMMARDTVQTTENGLVSDIYSQVGA